MRRRILAGGLALLLCAGSAIATTNESPTETTSGSNAQRSSSASFQLTRVVMASVADQLSSNGYEMGVTSVAIGGATGVCPSGAATTLGFWSFKGPLAVPVRLMAGKNAADPDDVDLFWSGQSQTFEIYRSTSPVGVVAPDNLYRTTGQCMDTDGEAEPHDLLFYKIEKVEP